MQLIRVDLETDGCLAHVVFRWGQIMEGGATSSVLPSFNPVIALEGWAEEYWMAELRPWMQSVHGEGEDPGGTGEAIAQRLKQSKPALPEHWTVGRVSMAVLGE